MNCGLWDVHTKRVQAKLNHFKLLRCSLTAMLKLKRGDHSMCVEVYARGCV
jgi:hypothetical protein